jgi:nitronate monooxygenase
MSSAALPPTRVVQAPVGSACSPELIAAVSNAGGLGILAGSWLTPDELRTGIRSIRRLTERPFGVNLVLAWAQHERLAVALEEGTPVISLFWGDPAPCLPAIRDAGATVVSTVGSADEAARHAALGVDLIVAQGIEAGGHVRGREPLDTLLPAVVAAVPDRPVLAAGGIATREDVARARGAGAAGVWVGTRFLASVEARVYDV